MGGLSFGGGFHGLYTFLKDLVLGASTDGDEITTAPAYFARARTIEEASVARGVTTKPGYVARTLTTERTER